MSKTGKVRVKITRELIEDVVKDDQEGVPQDATLVQLAYNAERDIYDAVFVSDEVPKTLEGVKVPFAHELEENDG